MPVRVVQSKGKKERYAKLSVKFLVVMDEDLKKIIQRCFYLKIAM
jgi:hypothetical protein